MRLLPLFSKPRNDGILKFPEAKRSQKAQEAQKG